MKVLKQKRLLSQLLLLLVCVLLGLSGCGGDSNSKDVVRKDVPKDIPIDIPDETPDADRMRARPGRQNDNNKCNIFIFNHI